MKRLLMSVLLVVGTQIYAAVMTLWLDVMVFTADDMDYGGMGVV